MASATALRFWLSGALLAAGCDAASRVGAPAAGNDASAPVDAGTADAPSGTGAAPRLVAPVSASYLTSRRPTFRWAPPSGAGGVTVDVCADRACDHTLATFTAVGDHATPSQDLPAGVLFWRVRNPAAASTASATSSTWELVLPVQSAPLSTAWGSMLDLDGDGLADVAVGDSDSFSATQHVYVYLGSPQGPPASPSAVLSAPAPVERYSESIASAGDVDGDGYVDLVVGSPHEDTVYLHRGGPGGPANPGVAIVGPTGSGLGWSVSGAGDVDGDGYADVVAGTPLQPPASGSQVQGGAILFYGGPDGLSASRSTVLPPRPGSDAQGLGTFVSNAGDVDGDSLADVAVWGGIESTDPQYVLVYLGRDRPWPSAPSQVLHFEGSTATWLGAASLLACAGDTNGDGYADLAVASCEPPSVGVETDHVSLFLGSAGALPLVPSRLVQTPLASGDDFAASLAALDANRDGIADLAVSALSFAKPPVAALVYTGGPAGPALSATLTTNDATTTYERELGSPGDIDGDGYADLVVGFPSRTTTLADAGPTADGGVARLHGAVEVHAGGPSGTGPGAGWTLLPPDPSSIAFGASLVR